MGLNMAILNIATLITVPKNTMMQLIRVTIMALIVSLSAACSSEFLQKPAPVVSFKTIQYQTKPSTVFDMASLKGQVTLVNFWATSCTTCVAEMPMLAKVYSDYAYKGYRTIAVAMDYDSIEFVRNFAVSRALPFDVVHDTDGSLAQAFNQVKVTPTSYLIDLQGRIVKRYLGEIKETDLTQAIDSLLPKK